jgi:hypothetical protein
MWRPLEVSARGKGPARPTQRPALYRGSGLGRFYCIIILRGQSRICVPSTETSFAAHTCTVTGTQTLSRYVFTLAALDVRSYTPVENVTILYVAGTGTAIGAFDRSWTQDAQISRRRYRWPGPWLMYLYRFISPLPLKQKGREER